MMFATMTLMLLAMGAAQAQATPPAPDGFAACSIIYPSKRRLIHTDPLPAARSATTDMARAFAANMQTRLYTDEPAIEMIGDCHWEPTSAKAEAYMNTIKRGITARGMTTFWMRYTPAAAR